MPSDLTEYVIIDSDGYDLATVRDTSPRSAVLRWAADQPHADWCEVVHAVDPSGAAWLVEVDVPPVEPQILTVVPSADPRIAKEDRERRLVEMTEPPADAWVQRLDGEWATTGHIAVRRDGPRPNTMMTCLGKIAAWTYDPALREMDLDLMRGASGLERVDPVAGAMLAGLTVRIALGGRAACGIGPDGPVVLVALMRHGAAEGVPLRDLPGVEVA